MRILILVMSALFLIGCSSDGTDNTKMREVTS
jgi:hypothetical protein